MNQNPDNVTTIREQYADMLADFYDRLSGDLKEMAKNWAANEQYHDAERTYIKSRVFSEVAFDLRRPKAIRLESEELGI
jgi:hypothetical protein